MACPHIIHVLTERTPALHNKQTDRQTYRQTDRQTDRHTDRQTDRQTDRHTDRQTDRETDTQTDTRTHLLIYKRERGDLSFSAFQKFNKRETM